MSDQRRSTTDAGATRERLLAAYSTWKEALRARGQLPSQAGFISTDMVASMSSEAQAGLWLVMYGEEALRQWDASRRGEAAKRWPEARGLIASALGVSS